jgi:hypothetical protein
MFPISNILVRTLFLTVIFRVSYFIARISTGSFFLATISQYNMVRSLEIIVRSEDPSENIQVGTLFLTVFPG